MDSIRMDQTGNAYVLGVQYLANGVTVQPVLYIVDVKTEKAIANLILPSQLYSYTMAITPPM
jgi:hypothetical protein